MTFTHLSQAEKAITDALSGVPRETLGVRIVATVYLSVEYPVNGAIQYESVTLDGKRRDVADFADKVSELGKRVSAAAKAARPEQSQAEIEAEAGIVTVK